jgi:3-dehydroquinate synthase
VAAAIDSLLPARTDRYREADLIVPTDSRSPTTVAAAIADALPRDGVERIAVDVHGFPHEIVVGSGVCHLLPGVLARTSIRGPVAVVTDSVVGPRHAMAVEQALQGGGWQPHRFELAAGEGAKSLETMNALYQFLAREGIDRSGAVIALGGGVVGDVAGFAAATWMRGIPYVQVPTTLLAMVDSSIGGKTAINLPAGKNLVGAVHQPAAIICDLEYLKTLPDAEYRAAWGEIIKCAVAGDRQLFDELKAARPAALGREEQVVRRIVARAAAFKARVVAEDPHDRSRRAVLNYGHTVAHAMEAALGYGAIRHGEAVAWGMRVAGRLSVDTGECSPATAQAQDSLLRDYSLLAEAPPAPVSQLIQTIQHDKKAQEGEPLWVLLRDIGHAEYGRRVPKEKVEAALRAVLAP